MLTFDQVIEFLEITDISKIKIEDLSQLEKKSKKRWHPDKVSHLHDPMLTQEYTEKFQQIEIACQIIRSYLNGTYQAGANFSGSHQTFEEPEEVIRKNAPDIQQTLKNMWAKVKEKKHKMTTREVFLSDGFKLRDLLTEDFKEDLAMLSVISFFYGLIILGILAAIAGAINPILGSIVAIAWLLQALACVLGFLPLSRFWLPGVVSDIMIKFINFGLSIYNWAEEQIQNSDKVWLVLLVRIPVLFAKLVKYLLLFPIYEIAKAITGNKVVGVVKQNVNYYADAAEWYIEELLAKNPGEMTGEELLHLSYLYTEFADIS